MAENTASITYNTSKSATSYSKPKKINNYKIKAWVRIPPDVDLPLSPPPHPNFGQSIFATLINGGEYIYLV